MTTPYPSRGQSSLGWKVDWSSPAVYCIANAFGNDVSENELKLYLAIKKIRDIVCVEVNRTRVILHLRLDAETIEFNDLVTDVRNKGHWGTGDVEVSLKTTADLEKVKPLLERTYMEN